ncbi:hypothetical protein DFQ27_001800 [Actinomortierella ambigua]|uniref:Cas12f1-like TNB domain-containing protein n=1 Tax=Actinomortierella ambigua TaxID=1343610 RepID=A0A9P6Q940_9FUNG|nr:hypothetical protein DFQ27_001800 [Actinomortierella ambigua]
MDTECEKRPRDKVYSLQDGPADPPGLFKWLLRPWCSRYIEYDIPTRLDKTGLSRAQYQALGVVSHTDCSFNLPRLGIATNIKIIKAISYNKDTASAILQRYYIDPKVVAAYAAHTSDNLHLSRPHSRAAAEKVYLDCQETPLSPYDRNNRLFRETLTQMRVSKVNDGESIGAMPPLHQDQYDCRPKGTRHRSRSSTSAGAWSQARGLGYIVVDVDEYHASRRCPRCKCSGSDKKDFVEYIGMRRAHCVRCGTWFHRDLLAASSMVEASHTYVTDLSRPEYLLPIAKHGRFVWNPWFGVELPPKVNPDSDRRQASPRDKKKSLGGIR